MWSLDVRFTPAEAGEADLRGKLILAVDALRFSATAAAALAAGARTVYPFETVAELRAFASTRPAGSFVTAGEEDAVQIPGLDLGNSPASFAPANCLGRDVLAVTTNGTRLLRAVAGLGRTVLFSFVNLTAAVEHAAKVEGAGVVVCAGWRGRYAEEDALAAGAFVDASARRAPELRLSEAAAAARETYLRAAADLPGRVRATEAAGRLASLGFADDIALCARIDALPLLPVARGSPLRLVPDDAEGEAPAPSAPPAPAPAGSTTAPAAGPPPADAAGRPEAPGPAPERRRLLGLSKEEVDGFRMPLGEHLRELRKRVIWSVVFLLAGFMGVFAVSETALDVVPVIEVVLRPASRAFDQVEAERREKAGAGDALAGMALQRPRLVTLAPYEAFMAHLKVCFFAGLFLSAPLVFWQLWLFVAAGLYPRERKWVYFFAPSTYVCFSTGVLFLYFVVLPAALRFLVGYAPHRDLMATMGFTAYVDFLLLFSLAMGIVFQLPLVMMFLSRVGLVHPKTYRAKRRHVIVGLFVVAAAVTPGPDVVSQILVALPLLALYEVGILLARLVHRAGAAPAGPPAKG